MLSASDGSARECRGEWRTGTRDGDKTIARGRRPLRLLNRRRRAEHAPRVIQCRFPYPFRTSRVGSDLPDCARDAHLANAAIAGQRSCSRPDTCVSECALVLIKVLSSLCIAGTPMLFSVKTSASKSEQRTSPATQSSFVCVRETRKSCDLTVFSDTMPASVVSARSIVFDPTDG